MKPNQFVFAALAAVVSCIVAVVAFGASNRWTESVPRGGKLVPALGARGADVGAVTLTQGDKSLTFVQSDNRWTIKYRGGYPVARDKMRAFLVQIAEAELVEPKTRNAARYDVLELEDPASKDAHSHGVRLADGKGRVVTEFVVGKRKPEAFGSGKDGTYVRRQGDPQTWLANTPIEAPLDVKSWINPAVFDVDAGSIVQMTLSVAGEDPLKLERGTDSAVQFVDFPKDKKLKETGAAEALLRAAASFAADDVRKLDTPPAGPDVSAVELKTKAGAEIGFKMRKDAEGTWISVTAQGGDTAKDVVDRIKGASTGWEFKIPAAKADAILKRRADLLQPS